MLLMVLLYASLVLSGCLCASAAMHWPRGAPGVLDRFLQSPAARGAAGVLGCCVLDAARGLSAPNSSKAESLRSELALVLAVASLWLGFAARALAGLAVRADAAEGQLAGDEARRRLPVLQAEVAELEKSLQSSRAAADALFAAKEDAEGRLQAAQERLEARGSEVAAEVAAADAKVAAVIAQSEGQADELVRLMEERARLRALFTGERASDLQVFDDEAAARRRER